MKRSELKKHIREMQKKNKKKIGIFDVICYIIMFLIVAFVCWFTFSFVISSFFMIPHPSDCPNEHEESCQCELCNIYIGEHNNHEVVEVGKKFKEKIYIVCNCKYCLNIRIHGIYRFRHSQHQSDCQYVECVLNHNGCNDCFCECPTCNHCEIVRYICIFINVCFMGFLLSISFFNYLFVEGIDKRRVAFVEIKLPNGEIEKYFIMKKYPIVTENYEVNIYDQSDVSIGEELYLYYYGDEIKKRKAVVNNVIIVEFENKNGNNDCNNNEDELILNNLLGWAVKAEYEDQKIKNTHQ